MQLLQLSLALLAVAATCVFLLRRRKPTPAGMRPIPSPPAHPLFGHIPLVAKSVGKGQHIDVLLQELSKQYGKVFSLNLLFFRMLIVIDPQILKEVITRNFPKSFTYNRFHPLIGGHKSILVLEGDAWKHQRTAFNPGFSFQHLRTLIPTFVSNTHRLIDKLSTAADSGEVVSIHRMLTVLTLNIICHIVLAKDFDLLSDERSPELYHRLNSLLDQIQWYAQHPGLGWTRRLPWNKRIMRWHESRYDDLLLEVIEERMSEVEGRGRGASDVAPSVAPTPGEREVPEGPSLNAEKSILSAAIQTAREEGSGLDKASILAQVKTFLFAGHDTTAATVAWAVYEVSQHPEVERKLVDEIRLVCGTRDPCADDLARLPYMECVLKETLRMWPPAGAARIGPPGAAIDGYAVEGLVFYFAHFVIHRDPDLWGEDAELFRPERWLDEDYISRLHPYAYQPFSKGPRDCIGQTFARLEAKALMAMLFSRFSFKYAGKEPERQEYKITSRPKFGCPMRVERRAL